MGAQAVAARSRRHVKRAIPHGLRRALHRVQERRKRRPGPPTSVPVAVLDRISRHWGGGPLDHAWHVELAGYKDASAHLVVLEATTGQQLRLVAKALPTDPAGYPAKVGYPGPLLGPEPAVLRMPSAELRAFVPTLLDVHEDPDHAQLRLFLQDLSPSHHKAITPADVRATLEGRGRLEPVLTPWLHEQDPTSLTTWDDEFRARVLDWSRSALEDFVRVTGDAHVREFLDHWDLLAQAYLHAGPEALLTALHGDLRRDHVFLGRGGSMRLVDWEYAGWGWVHNDLVSLFKGLEPPLVRQLLHEFARTHQDLTAAEHLRMYNRAVIERGLLDAALVIRHRLVVHDRPWVHRDHFDAALQAAGHVRHNRDAIPFEGGC